MNSIIYNFCAIFFTIIKGKKQKSQTVYAAISVETWDFVLRHFKEFFFIAAIEENDNFSYYCYTPTEMWSRSRMPNVQVKCNPLKKKKTLKSILETLRDPITESRYEGAGSIKDSLKELSRISKELKVINPI